MAYSASRGDNYDPSQSYSDQKRAEDARNTQNNAKNVRNAADVAIASKNPYAMAAGAAVKGADKLTGGKASEAIGKGLTKANKVVPGGNQFQRASNRLSESGASDAIGKGAAMKNQFSGGGGTGATAGGSPSNVPSDVPQNANNVSQEGGGQNGSLPSSSVARTPTVSDSSDSSDSGFGKKKKNDDDDGNNDGDDKGKSSGFGSFLGRQIIITVVLTVAPFILLLLLFIMIIAMVTGIFNDYEDAFGMSTILGQETGGLSFTASSEEQEKFYDRVNDVKLNYQMQGKTIDAMMIVAVLHSLQANGVDIQYDDVTTAVIQEWADASLNGNSYDEELFRKNLESTIFPKYKPNGDAALYKDMADEVFNYIERYNDLVGDGTGAKSSGEFSTWKQGDAQWGKTPMGNSGKTLSQIGCLVTSVSMLIAKSGVPCSVKPLNPGTFVEFLNKNGGINSGGNFQWGAATKAAPSFKYQGQVSVAGMSREQKLAKIKEIVNQKGVYAVAEVKGNTGQHWVAIDGVSGSTINMMDPSSSSTDMWAQYNWANTSTIAYYRVG